MLLIEQVFGDWDLLSRCRPEEHTRGEHMGIPQDPIITSQAHPAESHQDHPA
jgi:hypothetical protein